MKKMIGSIIDWFKQSNRYKHFYCGAIWCFFFYCCAIIMTKAICPSFWLSLLSTTGIAFALEYKDHAHGGKFDEDDIIATIYGAIGALLIGVLLTFILRVLLTFILRVL